jgi:hypothetical protein
MTLNAASMTREAVSPQKESTDSVRCRIRRGHRARGHRYAVQHRRLGVDAAPPPNPAAAPVAQVGGLPGVLPQPPQTGTLRDR